MRVSPRVRRRKEEMPLTPRQALFVSEYLKDFNALQAGIRAGYSVKAAACAGSELLKDPRVAAQLSAAVKKVLDKNEVTVDWVVAKCKQLVEADLRDFVDPETGLALPLHKLPKELTNALSSYSVDATGGSGDGQRKRVERTKAAIHNKVPPLELLAKYLGMLKTEAPPINPTAQTEVKLVVQFVTLPQGNKGNGHNPGSNGTVPGKGVISIPAG